MKEKPYLDFYAERGASLVSRDITEIDKFFDSREALYIALGVPPGLLKGRSVIEFGPGTGHNSLYTDRLMPRKYTLVDGGKKILEAAEQRLEHSGTKTVERKYVHSLFEELYLDETFDLVIAEACIPNQKDPISLLKHISRFVAPGGVLIVTTVSPVSWLSEIIRRLVRSRVVSVDESPETQVNILRPLLAQHIARLKHVSRSVDDWLLDNVVQPLNVGNMFTIPEAIQAFSSDWRVLGASPRFFNDWTWYSYEYKNL